MNKQKPEKSVSNLKLEVHSIFETIQGEGPFSGHRAIFVRLFGCNIQCPDCDTSYTDKRTKSTPEEVLISLSMFGPRFVVITGGEPFRQKVVTKFANLLIANGYLVQFETNGTYRIPDNLNSNVVIVVSPKTQTIHKSFYKHPVVFKYVLTQGEVSQKDGLPISVLNNPIALNQVVARPADARVYITPADFPNNPKLTAANHKLVAKTAMKYGYIAQVQLHKKLGVE